MAEIWELHDSRAQTAALDPTQQGLTLRFGVSGTDDDNAVRSIVQGYVPAFWAGLRINNYTLDPQGNGLWFVDAHYGTRYGAQGGGGGLRSGGMDGGSGTVPTGILSFSFDTGEEKVKVAQASSFVYYPAPDRLAINYRGTVGIKKDDGKIKVEGVDIESPIFNFTVGRTFTFDGALTGDIVTMLIDKAWHVNADAVAVTILGISLFFEVGELLFKGATGSQKGGGLSLSGPPVWEGEVTLKFAAQKNLTNQTIGGIAGITKPGWDYLEPIYEEIVEANRLVPNPVQMNVNRVRGYTPLMPLFTG